MRKPSQLLPFALLFSLLLVLAFAPILVEANEPDAQDLQTVWDRVRDSGAYAFRADLTQTTSRIKADIAYGPSEKTTRVHMEGETDLTAGSLELTLWNGGGSVILPESGTQIRIADGQAMARRGNGPWQQIDDFSSMVAPGGDFLAFLAAADNVIRHEPEILSTSLGETVVTRFSFDINGPQYAAYMRDLLEEQLRSRGELPPGMSLGLPEAYAEMTGRGELVVGEDGLPLRQEFELAFPAGAFGAGSGPSTAQIAVTFSEVGGPAATTAAAAPLAARLNPVWQQTGETFERLASYQNMFAVLAVLVIIISMATIIHRSRSRKVYAGVALSISFSLLFSPLLNSMHVSAYGEKQVARRAAQEAQQAEAESAEAWQEALSNPDFDPHMSPLALAKTRQEELLSAQSVNSNITGGSVISATSNSSPYFDSSCVTDPGNDNDGDGLTNLEECLIGTLPGSVDTDNDGVDDDLEVKGFVYDDNSSVTWYTNPLYPDTNRDGLGDGSEWNLDADNDGKPDDTDADGVPDIWDDDNDGDGVPDDLDLSPYTTTKDNNVFDGNNPLQLIVDDLGEGLITKVEFQLTPTDPDHLWYTNNVLDWADNDRQGQMQDADGLTFYDVDNTIDPFPNDLGDVRLVPMLEIEITGTPTNLPDQHTLNQFGIKVHDSDANTKTAYVPVSLVTDTTGNKNVAFHGAMYYQAASTWGNAQIVRLVWMVQALVDVCDTYKNGICDTYSAYNDLQVIQTYDEEWYLTGMEVSEEQGTSIATIYEDPAETSDAPLYMDTIFPLAYGLDRTFMAGADCEVVDENDNCVSGNGRFDLTVTGIYTRFNHTTNGGVSDTQRWGLDNVFTVVTQTYPAVELAMLDTVITQTKGILADAFTSEWSAANPITPTIMFAWEQNYRVVSLSSDHLSWSGNILTVDVASSGADPVLAEQTNGMKWAPFGYNPVDDWFAADISHYWQQLDELLPSFFSGDDDVAADVATSKFLYMGMYSGETQIVRIGDQHIAADYEFSDLPLQLKIASYVGSGTRKAVNLYFGEVSTVRNTFKIIDNEGEEPLWALARLSLKVENAMQKWWSLLEETVGIVGIGLLIVVAAQALIVAGLYLYMKYIAHDNISTGWIIAGAVSMGILAFVMGVLKPILGIIRTINELVAVGAAASKAEAVGFLFSGEGAPSLEYNVMGLLIAVTIAVAFFLILVISGQVKPGSIAFQFLLAQTIASIITAIILFILALNPFTALLVGLAALIDLILFALGIDFSITGKLTKAIADVLYEFDLAVDMGVDTGRISTELVNPAEGMIAGNQMIFTLPITTVITQTSKVNISEDDMRSNSIVYNLDAFDAYQTGLATSHGDRADEWQVSQLPDTRYIGIISDTVSYIATLPAGVNRSLAFYLDSAYDLLGESCWKIPGTTALPTGTTICDNKYVDGTSSTNIGSIIVFDVYPSTVEGFITVAGWANGNVRIADADGDGLLPLGEGGIDPDDTSWDMDGDNLSDQFELEMRALPIDDGGEELDPALLDTDGDGIPDDEELWLATNPANADTDGDGLPDIEEAARVDEDLLALTGGWLFAYNINAFTRVWSDPTHADYDGDGMSDLFEQTLDTCPDCTPWADPDNPLLFSPYVYNENPVPLYLDDNTNNGFVTPSTGFVYSTTTANNLSDGILLAGDVALTLPDIFSGAPLMAEVALNSGYSETLVSEVVPAVSSSATGVLTSSMDLAALEDVVWAWDPPSENSWTPFAGDILQIDAAVAPGFSDLYVLASLENDGVGGPTISAYATGNDGIPTDTNFMADYSDPDLVLTAPSVACNNSGVCLIVWGQPDTPNGGKIYGSILNGSVSQASVQTVGHAATGTSVSAPSVASDGENFLVGWSEYTGSEGSTWVRQVSSDGTLSSSEEVWQVDFGGANPIGLEWTGSNYLAVWVFYGAGVMYRAEIDTALNVGPVTSLPGDKAALINPGGVISPLELAYDTLSQQALVVHRGQSLGLSNFNLSATRFSTSGVSPVINLDTDYNNQANAAVCADPINGGWIVAWSRDLFSGSDSQIMYQAIAPDGSLRDTEQVYIGSTDHPPLAIACRAPHPLLDLEFEEEATSASYADSSQYGHDATCSGAACPVGGVEGRFGNGVQFDGVNDRLTSSFTQPTSDFTVEFWMKTNCQDCDLLNHLGGNASIYLDNGQICIQSSGSSGSGSLCSPSSINFADGDWHHVFHATNGQGQYLYIDGAITDYTSFNFTDVACSSNCDQFVLGTAGSNFFSGTLDQVRFYNRFLSSAEAFESFSNAVAILDLDETAGSTLAFDATNGGFNATCSGSTCPTFGVDGMASTAASFDGSNDFLVIDTQKRTLESVIYDFESGNTAGWSNGTISSATRNGSATDYLGSFGNQTVTLDLTNLPTHDTVTIEFDLYVLGSWDGNRTDSGPDIWKWGNDGIPLLNTTFSNQPNISPNYQMYPANYPYSFEGITLYDHPDFSGAFETFIADDADLTNNTIGNDHASAFSIFGDTVSILYRNINYGDTSWIMDPKRGNYNVPDDNAVSSLRVFSSLHSPEYGSTGDTLAAAGFSDTAVYHIEYTLDNHTDNSLNLFFEGLASDDGQEQWGLDNVVVQVQSDGSSVPLTNNSFTLSAWAKRDSNGTSDYIISQGSAAAGQGVYFGFEGNNLVCSIWGHTLSYAVSNDGEWHHVACVFYAAATLEKLELYYDGAQVINQSNIGTDYSGFGETYIGKRFDNAGPFDGSLDEVAMWIHVLTDDQILELYQKVKVEDQSVLHALLPAQQGSSLLTLDLLLRETASEAGTEAQVVTRTIGIDADVPSATILAPENGAYVNGFNPLEISGSAGDPTSYVTDVEIQVDGGAWVTATGTASWDYTIPAGTFGEGLHTVAARATDVVGFTGNAASVQFIVDDTAPDITLTTGGNVQPFLDEQGRWLVPISGTAADPNAGSQPGSGLESVEVLLQGGPNVVGNGWQTTTLSAENWTLDYILPQVGTGNTEISNPTGAYTLTVRATDAVGNTTPEADYATSQLTIEVDPPVPTLTTVLPVTQAITTSLTLSGVISDATFISSVEIGFIPGKNIGAIGEAALHVPFDENNILARFFSDRSGANNPAGCNPATCPLVGQNGQRDRALEFDGLTQHAFIADDDSIDFGADEDFTVALWVYADPVQPSTGTIDNAIVEKWSGAGGYPYVIRYLNQTGKIRARRYDGSNNPGVDSTTLVNDGQFHHIAFVKSGNTLSLYIDGQLEGTATDTTTGATTNSSDLFLARRGGGSQLIPFKGILDELVIHDRALADYEIADLYDYGQTIWAPATFESGVINPTWSYTIPEGEEGLEGIYQINVRATDIFSNVTEFADQRIWRGEIDTLPPRSTFTAGSITFLNTTVTTFDCSTTDFNLVVNETCIVQPPDTIPVFGNSSRTLDTYASADPWYGDVISDTSRIYSFSGNVVYNGSFLLDMSLQSCDAYGRCTVVTNSAAPILETLDQTIQATENEPAERQLGLALDTAVLTPTTGTVLTSTIPVTVAGAAIADAGLQSLSVTANGLEVYTQNWPVTPTITNTLWSFAWTPPGEGIYLLESEVQDWLGNSTLGSLTSTVTVDTAAPTIAISPVVLTTTHQFGDNAMRMTGSAIDSLQVHRVEVQINGGLADDAGLDGSGGWEWPWLLEGQPDGETFNVTAIATDLAGRTAVDNQNVLVDIVPPERVTVTLAYQDNGGQILPISAGDTLTDAVALEVSWTASSDGSGIAAYRAGWSQSATPVLSELTSYPGAGTHTQAVGEAETWYAHVLVVDGTGNVTAQSRGPIYVDGWLTPDEIDNLGYHGWANEVCAIEGVDRRLVQISPTANAGKEQRFYVSWDVTALRLYWEGANWNHDGDLFVYLDTRPGGSDRLYNPYPEDPNTIYLPGNFPDPVAGTGERQLAAQASIGLEAGQSAMGAAMGADYMVWVEDSRLATLYYWDGYSWAIQRELDNDYFRLDLEIGGNDTDLWLPFAEIGIADPAIAALGLVAVATEEEALQIWSTMPMRNPVNSDRAVNPLAGLDEEHTFPLVRHYFWNSLGSGLCGNGRLSGDGSGPTGGPFADSDLQLTLSTDPVGTTYTFMNDEMAWLWALLFGFEDLPVVPSELFNHQDNDHPPLGAGQSVTFTIQYANLGTETANDVVVDLEAWYSLQLTGSNLVELGNISGGATGSVQITAFIDPTGVDPEEQEWAALDAFVYDEQYPENPGGGSWSSAPLEWMWSDHRVDVRPPSAVTITAPDFAIPAGLVTIRGQVSDESPVPLITLEILNESGDVETIACADETPTDGRWSCAWDASGTADGATIQVRAQATDIFGQTGEWTVWHTYEVDAIVPTFSVSNLTQVLGPGIHHLNGALADERQTGFIQVCHEDGECFDHTIVPQPDVPPGTLSETGIWASYLLEPVELEVDGQEIVLKIYGFDAVGNRTEAYTATYTLDNKPPELNVTYLADFVPALGTHIIAGGTVIDGTNVDVNVLVDPPAGSRQRLKAVVNGDDWEFHHGWTETGIYTLWVQAIDAAGNATTVGPFTIIVGEANHVYLPFVFNNAALVPDSTDIYLPIVVE